MQRDNIAKRLIIRTARKPQAGRLTDPTGSHQALRGQKIALVGGSGKLGKELVPALHGAGAELFLFGRDAHRLRQLFPGMESADSHELAQAFQIRSFSAVIDVATLNNRAQASLAEFRAVNVARTVKLAAEAHAAKIPLFISLSSTHAIEPDNDHPYAVSKREARELLLSSGYPTARLLVLPKIVSARHGSARAHFWTLLGVFKPIAFASDVVEVITGVINDRKGSPREVYVPPVGALAYSSMSRLLDISVALLLLFGAGWIMLLLAIWIKADSKGPAIFAQRRVGRHEKPFTLYKFRTMAVGTRQAGTHELTAASVTPAGAVLRRLKLDELPQVFNIFRGELSLVGPRPCLPLQEELVMLRRKAGIFELRPGLTGLAQVHGVDMSDPAELVSWEVRYLRLRRLLFDLRIVLQTFIGRGGGDRTVG